MQRRVLLGIVIALSTARPVLGQVKPTSPVFVVDLASATPTSTVVSAKTFNEALASVLPTDAESLAGVPAASGLATPIDRIVDACTPPPPTSEAENNALLKGLKRRESLLIKLQGCVSCLKAHQELRYRTAHGDDVLLIVLFKSLRPDEIVPTFIEDPRSSELVATAKALIGVLTAKEDLPLDCRAFTYTLVHQRSNFKVTVTYPNEGTASGRGASASPESVPGSLTAAAAPAAPATASSGSPLKTAAAPAAPASASSDTKELTTPTAILGPGEHWIFSLDFSMPVTSVHLGETPKPDAKQLEQKDFFIALNFSIGDLLVDRKSAVQKPSLWDDLLLKMEVTPSKTPWESWAFGAGIRGNRLAPIWNFDVAHPYVTFGSQKEDDTDKRHWRTVFGIGFDPRSLVKK